MLDLPEKKLPGLFVSACSYSEKHELKDLFVGLPGIYQQKNVATVLTAIDVLNRAGFGITERALRAGFERVVELTGLLGRWQVLQQNPTVICDIGHNEAGIGYAVRQLKTISHGRLHVVLGMVKDKDVDKVLSLLPAANTVYYFTKASIPRAMNELELQQKALGYKLQGNAYATVKEAFETAMNSSATHDVVFVGGSNFVVAEVLLSYHVV
jgi:dihydrofolate synthase/folylpolyglutamate synthase